VTDSPGQVRACGGVPIARGEDAPLSNPCRVTASMVSPTSKNRTACDGSVLHERRIGPGTFFCFATRSKSRCIRSGRGRGSGRSVRPMRFGCRDPSSGDDDPGMAIWVCLSFGRLSPTRASGVGVWGCGAEALRCTRM